jgi:N-acetylglucosaminyldiphosphoundecaprenol N-acetyl-beta-D-mannosaminyltransferase
VTTTAEEPSTPPRTNPARTTRAPHLRRSPLPIDALSLAETARYLDALLVTLTPAEAAQVVTLNPELVMRARRDAGLAQIIRSARVVTADGAGILWALRLRGQRAPARVTGVDLAQALAQRAAASGYSIFLLGAGPGVAQAAADTLRRSFPALRIAGCWGGSPSPRDDAEATARIRASGARLALVAYGAPAQELWIARNLPALPGVVAVGVGGALDMLAGRIPRAPRWMRVAGLEWLFRLWRQPWRWRRMLALPHFALLACAAAAHEWLTRRPDTGILAMRDPARTAHAQDTSETRASNRT